jgi:hypothetical protein
MTTDDRRATMDRRSLIKKAVAAGGVAWVAPTLISTPAGAAEVSSPPGAAGPPVINAVTTTLATANVSFTAGAAGTTPTSDYEYSLDNGVTWVSAGTTTSPFTISGLTLNSYALRIRAVNGSGPSVPSNAFTITRVTTPFAANATTVQNYTVATGVLQVGITAIGGAGGTGGAANGLGGTHGQPGQSAATPTVTPGESLAVAVGTGGGDGAALSNNAITGGGAAGVNPDTGYDGGPGGNGNRQGTNVGAGGGGGAAALVRRGATALVVAGGGGGGGGARQNVNGLPALATHTAVTPASTTGGTPGNPGNSTGGSGAGGGGTVGGAGGAIAATGNPGNGGFRGSNTPAGGAASGRTAGQGGTVTIVALQATPA